MSARPALAQHIALVAQGAMLHRQAAGADAAVEPVAQCHQLVDALIQRLAPLRREALPVSRRGRAAIREVFQGLANFKDLPQASSLCGACYESCPVKINIPKHLINLRRDIVQTHLNGPIERAFYRFWARSMKSPRMYALLGWFQKFDLRRRAKGSGWVNEVPSVAAGWTQIRDLPAPARHTFHSLWRQRGER